MTHARVVWKHADPDYPVLIFGELDDERWELRKVEIFLDGSRGWACADGRVGGTGLGEAPWPELAEIALDPEFDPCEISAEAFETEWRLCAGAPP